MIAYIDKTQEVPFVTKKLAVVINDTIKPIYGINDIEEIKSMEKISISNFENDSKLVFDGKSYKWIKNYDIEEWRIKTFKKCVELFEESNDPEKNLEILEQMYDLIGSDVALEKAFKQYETSK